MSKFSRKVLAVLTLGCAALVFQAPMAQAQGVTIVYKSLPSVGELSNELFGTPLEDPTTAAGMRTRGMTPQGHESAVDAAPPADVEVHWASTAAVAVAGEPVKKLAFNIQFAFDSAQMQPGSVPYIDRLGEVLQATNGTQLVIVGHTDAAGSDSYNRQLSVARAASVRDYLIANWQIAPDRLAIDGRGEAQLLTSIPPIHPTHRRVEFWAPSRG